MSAKSFPDLTFRQDFQRLPSAFYQAVAPQGLAKPEIVLVSPSCAELLDLDPKSLVTDDMVQVLSGNAILPGWNPIAMKYFGHQFGYLNPDLGDGRGLLLAEVETAQHGLWDLHLKGAGKTPFSRDGDGRAVLRSSIREFLCSEALGALGVPTTRALCVLNSETPVYREQTETGAMLMRVAQTHIRFGHLEFAYRSGDTDILKRLCDYLIERHYPDLEGCQDAYAALFRHTAEKTGVMIAHWQAIGFAHGVMNTDNMSMLGDTFDFGPYSFLDRFEPGYICNHSDHEGRYAFDRQPGVAHWNLSVLAQAMSRLVPKEALAEGIRRFSEVFNNQYLSLMRGKLGFFSEQADDQRLIFETLNFMSGQGVDYPFFFRHLSHGNETILRDHVVDREAFSAWYQDYQARLALEAVPDAARQEAMCQVNPKYVLRNHLAQVAIEQAQKGDYKEVNRLHQILQQPYAEQAEHNSYADLPPDWAEGIEISCSS